ncbi:MAG: type IX secretion system membrane protein PorP/SprF [Flavobacteriales bacterium]|nr:type IX secretion system membrane protein PorP/SprF [Flavobacteriales bacterium]
MNRRTIPFLGAAVLLAGVSLRTVAQQDPLFSQYMFNTLAFNPAYAGQADVLSFVGTLREQWVGLDGAPSTQCLAVNSPLRKQSLALGGLFLHDRIGPSRQTAFYADFAYRIRTGENSRLAFGLSGGAMLYQADLSSLPTVEQDPANANIKGEWAPNFGFGMYWWSKRHYLGISAPKLLTNELNATTGTIVSYGEARHYFLMGGMVFDLGRDVKFKPSFLLRAVEGAPFSADINANFLLREKLWFGGMYRLGNSFGIMFQYLITDQLRFGYAFDLTTTSMRAYNNGTHELMIGYDMRFAKGKAVSPRYF